MWLGLVVVAMLVGAGAAGTALALGQPLWVAVAVYSAAGTAGLCLAAGLALWAAARPASGAAPAAPAPPRVSRDMFAGSETVPRPAEARC